MSTPASNDLLLDTFDHETDDRSLKAREDIVGVCSGLLTDVLARRVELPSIPRIAIRIGRAVRNSNATNDDIARIIQQDPSLTARLMKIVNSPAFAARARIDNCPEAVARLGRDSTRNLVVSLVLKNMFYTHSSVLRASMAALWQRSSKVGAICHVLTRWAPGLVAERAMLAGLVHEIGMISILRRLEDHPQLIDSALFDITPIRASRSQIGAAILRQWRFADECVDAVLNADHWTRPGSEQADYTDLVLVARIHAAFGTPAARHLPELTGVPAFRKLALGGLDADHSIQALVEARSEIDSVHRLIAG